MAREILVIDDDPEIRQIVAEALGDEGYNVAAAENGQQAFELLSQRPRCLLLLDLMMPVMDGFTFLAKLPELDPEGVVPVVVITAAPPARSLPRATKLLSKPFSLDLLLETVETCCPRNGRPAGIG